MTKQQFINQSYEFWLETGLSQSEALSQTWMDYLLVEGILAELEELDEKEGK